MDFSSMKELIELCEQEKKSIAEIMIEVEERKTKRSKESIIEMMKERLIKMKEAIDLGAADATSAPSGISGGDAYLMERYREKEKPLTGTLVSDAMRFAFATSETNARMGVIVATPTAGSAGILPGCLFSLHENARFTYEHLVLGLFTASAIGYVIANRAFVSGAAGGCQAEVGSATAMAAAAIVECKQGTPRQAVMAAAMALKSMLGLVCDPVAGLVEVPCIKRNVIGTSIAFAAADMALAGIESRIPCDEVIAAMYDIGRNMPRALRETALGGLAVTPTGQEMKRRIMG
ncbi:L-serine ammonia-lyase, iron-sulfur-dependent, subunit alpha [Brevibacillus borstelensis]|jgi:L-serine dehydratase|uniref:L-serine ammonia-lyase, iron-sulfur-dependent, subunit alpha n=1 Tax=Brevibacillus borstelensis TaxID=45462 RepID=UPI000469D43A|nr:L-serine ammonia-lyase, iron-sulfur-dependent, subunit alpha [Brevibacillus borstelensis]MCC0565680.1 L-serine ammonia-lyase, iron-sulfur-dependent, subunit alpha [Brevibacillus borstelensis]MCM3471479.1 L-serine ammonia-lyase, iron-sulfur-dependent, subunit alpha [Brevibacillus borstelensis]MCM3559569.1 L-serine ammonia-lyase, iron-sulfur-dependent, subunit alpha [Brevibacillus borstelensis]MCM3592838.1 L-serine ammonia-lyase, iron-sulfur-dependent, subunit alpha [Brevibacillus borstelensis